MLNRATVSIHIEPETTSAADHGDGQPIDDGGRAHRDFAGQPLADFGDIERAEHGTHAESPQHDAVGLGAAMQQVACHQRHQGRYRTARDAGDQRARQHDTNGRRVPYIAHPRDHRPVEPLARQA
jgi:hypothetical protein